MKPQSRFTPRPSLSEFLSLSQKYDRVPVVVTAHSDIETPLSAYLKLGGAPGSFLLESVEKNEKVARFSVVGFSPSRVFEARDGKLTERVGRRSSSAVSRNPLAGLRDRYRGLKQAPLPGGPGFAGGLVGFLSYDIVRSFEKLPALSKDELRLPDLALVEADLLALFDHLDRTLRLVANVPSKGGAQAYRAALKRLKDAVRRLERPLRGARELPLPEEPPAGADALLGFKSNVDREAFLQGVKACQEYIRAGDVIQVVLSQRFSKETEADAVTVYRFLRRLNPSPYMFLLRQEGLDLVGSSPEMLLKVQDGVAETRPIAGTRPRGKDEAGDKALEEGLLKDPKELAEHVMLVDLGRNDLGRVCRFGTVKVPEFQRVERYSHVMHIVSDVKGDLDGSRTSYDALQSCFPAGTLSGAPKIRAMEIIEELEPSRRGAYGGCVAILGFDGNLDSAITIRSAFVCDDRLTISAGAGIVADSDPRNEFLESENKLGALTAAMRRCRIASGEGAEA